MEIQSETSQKPFEKSFARKKRFAFLTTAMSCFVLMCFFGAMIISNFETKTSMDISSSGIVSEEYFRELIDDELTDGALSNHLIAAEKNSVLVENQDIAARNLDAVRAALSFRSMEKPDGNQYRISVVFRGRGSEDEKKLTQTIIKSLARKVSGTDNIAASAAAVKRQFGIIQAHLEANSSRLSQELETANDLVNDLNLGLSEVHQSVELLGPDDRINASFNDQVGLEDLDRSKMVELLDALQLKLQELKIAEDEKEFYELGKTLARINDQLQDLGLEESEGVENSMRIVNAAMPETNSAVKSILELLAVCDTDSIQTQIGRAQQNLHADSIQLREDLTSIELMSKRLTESRYVVNAVSPATTIPAESQPGIGYLLMLGLIAIVVGSVVATYYRPEIENVGFDSSEAAEKILGVSVIANITERSNDNELESNNLANSIVRYSEVGLFGFVLLTVVLCLVQPELAQSFLESPIYGLSRMSGMFFS